MPTLIKTENFGLNRVVCGNFSRIIDITVPIDSFGIRVLKYFKKHVIPRKMLKSQKKLPKNGKKPSKSNLKILPKNGKLPD